MTNLDRKTKGILAEQLTKETYQKNGYSFLASNYRYKRSEIDLIVKKNDHLLVFVEVKMRSSPLYGEAESFVSNQQILRIKEAAEEFILKTDWKKDVRFDIACVNSHGRVEIFEDAF